MNPAEVEEMQGKAEGEATKREQPVNEAPVVKKRKPKKNAEMTEEQKIDENIRVKKRILEYAHGMEDEEFDLNNEDGFEKCVFTMNQRDRCLRKAVELEQTLRATVEFEDLEEGGGHDDLIHTMQSVPERVMITNSGLEPLNMKLTDYINNPAALLPPNEGSRVILPAFHYPLPEFDEIKRMIEDIRAQGDCPLVDELAPKDNPTVYDEFVKKVLGDVSDRLKPKRGLSMLENIEQEALERQNPAENPSLDNDAQGIENGNDICGISQKSTHELFTEAKQRGEIQAETDAIVLDAEDVYESMSESDELESSPVPDESANDDQKKTETTVSVGEPKIETYGDAPTPSTSASSTHVFAANSRATIKSTLDKLFECTNRLRSSSAMSSTGEPEVVDLTRDSSDEAEADDDADVEDLGSDDDELSAPLSASLSLDVIEEDSVQVLSKATDQSSKLSGQQQEKLTTSSTNGTPQPSDLDTITVSDVDMEEDDECATIRPDELVELANGGSRKRKSDSADNAEATTTTTEDEEGGGGEDDDDEAKKKAKFEEEVKKLVANDDEDEDDDIVCLSDG